MSERVEKLFNDNLCAVIKEGIIEIYYYNFASDEIRQPFLAKWNQQHSIPYTEETGLVLYIGQKDKTGKFYGGYDEFYEPLDFPQKSGWWRLVEQILEEGEMLYVDLGQIGIKV